MFRYYNNDFGVLSRSGANYTALCPECGKENLSLSPAKHMAKCFTAGCGFKAGEFRDEPRPEDEPYGIPVESERNKRRENMISEYSMEKVNPFSTYVTSDEQVPVLISDYGRKEITLKDKIAVLTSDADENSAEGMRMVRKYLQDMGIGIQTAIDSGIMAGTLSFSAKEMKHSNAENEYEQLPVIIYPYFVGEKIVAMKARTVSMRNGQYEKAFHAEKAYKELPTPPFGINELQKQQYDKIIITEGEKDCLALREAGFWNAISVPNGAGDDIRKCLAPFMHLFDAASEIIICGDNDFRGRFLQMRLMYIFQGRSRLVEIDPTEGKDIADVLLNQGTEAVREKILSAKSFSDSKTIRPNDIEDDVLNALRGVSIESFSLGYGPLTDRHFRLTNRGGLVVVTGLPGDGKSDFLYDMAAHLINAHRKRFTFCSMEEPDVQEVFGDMIHRILDRADLTQYPISITKDANQVETAKLRGFIKDLRQFLLDSFEVLQITSDIAILETANDTYEELYMARIREKSESAVSTECRANTEAAFLQISYTLAATANMVSTDVDQMMKISRCANVIDEINVLIRDFKSKAYRGNNDNEESSDEQEELSLPA